ncbi:uncharacterized protein CDV56_109170 [Aspergillus thermomutatus]|uniref:Uncharacterized protein n=1 Tax=Aspergillus thermomutatus TaxID=41047 RepID=A0A397HY95_ASPTH|nr:uncharacterized protein CDV56_109170 [Aspergillus thermomutatus]RHZ66516.1 hypothetical protein CDV56_109170 [Aspergillus thermomutatus]
MGETVSELSLRQVGGWPSASEMTVGHFLLARALWKSHHANRPKDGKKMEQWLEYLRDIKQNAGAENDDKRHVGKFTLKARKQKFATRGIDAAIVSPLVAADRRRATIVLPGSANASRSPQATIAVFVRLSASVPPLSGRCSVLPWAAPAPGIPARPATLSQLFLCATTADAFSGFFLQKKEDMEPIVIFIARASKDHKGSTEATHEFLLQSLEFTCSDSLSARHWRDGTWYTARPAFVV